MFRSGKQEEILELQNFQCRRQTKMHLSTHPFQPVNRFSRLANVISIGNPIFDLKVPATSDYLYQRKITAKVENIAGSCDLMSYVGITTLVSVWCNRICPTYCLMTLCR